MKAIRMLVKLAVMVLFAFNYLSLISAIIRIPSSSSQSPNTATIMIVDEWIRMSKTSKMLMKQINTSIGFDAYKSKFSKTKSYQSNDAIDFEAADKKRAVGSKVFDELSGIVQEDDDEKKKKTTRKPKKSLTGLDSSGIALDAVANVWF